MNESFTLGGGGLVRSRNPRRILGRVARVPGGYSVVPLGSRRPTGRVFGKKLEAAGALYAAVFPERARQQARAAQETVERSEEPEVPPEMVNLRQKLIEPFEPLNPAPERAFRRLLAGSRGPAVRVLQGLHVLSGKYGYPTANLDRAIMLPAEIQGAGPKALAGIDMAATAARNLPDDSESGFWETPAAAYKADTFWEELAQWVGAHLGAIVIVETVGSVKVFYRSS